MASRPDPTLVVDAQDVDKSFGATGVLRRVGLHVNAGDVLTVFGPNGAGKTTLIRILSALSRPDAGTVRVNGFDAFRQGEAARATIGVVLHASLLYGDLTARENLRFYANMFRVGEPERRIQEVAARMNVAHRLDDRVRSLSHGLAKRVSFARALLPRPRLLLLDEPETGLDQHTLGIFETLLTDYRAVGGAVVMTTHSLERGLALSNRVAILAHGRFVYSEARENVELATLRDVYARYTGES